MLLGTVVIPARKFTEDEKEKTEETEKKTEQPKE